MAGGSSRMDADARCAEIARVQFGLIARFQALQYLSAAAIKRRCASGRWQQVLRGVYALSGAPQSEAHRIMAAVLWARGRAETRARSCASHETAARLWRIGGRGQTIHLISPRPLKIRDAEIVVHRVELEEIDITAVHDIPVTTVARTLFDLGATHSLEEVESALEAALRKGLVSLPRLRWQVDRSGGYGRRGSSTLRRLLEERSRGYIPYESELELRLFRILKRARLPLPVRQKVIKHQGRFIARVDYAYPSRQLVIEVHGWKHHGAKDRWQSDLARGNLVMLSGARTLEFTWHEVTREPQEVASLIRRALELCPGSQGTLLPRGRKSSP